MRSHLFRPVMDSTGALMYGATVTVFQATVSALLDQTMFSAPTGSDALSNPFVTSNGYIDIWLNNPERCLLLIQTPDHPDISVYLDANPAASEIVHAATGFAITNTGTSAQLLTAQGDGTARWVDPPTPTGTVGPHNHEGAGTQSLALGTSAAASAPRSSAVGDTAVASGLQSSAFGQAATSSGDQSTSFGASSAASGQGSIAVGYQAQATGINSQAVGYGARALGDLAVAIGSLALGNGATAIAIGNGATVDQNGGIALGSGSTCGGIAGMAIGTGATVGEGHDYSVAVGPGATTTQANQMVLGAATHAVLVKGLLSISGAAVLAGSGQKVGFYGSAGAVKQTVTGSRGGNAVLATLLTYLASLGLITDGTTV